MSSEMLKPRWWDSNSICEHTKLQKSPSSLYIKTGDFCHRSQGRGWIEEGWQGDTMIKTPKSAISRVRVLLKSKCPFYQLTCKIIANTNKNTSWTYRQIWNKYRIIHFISTQVWFFKSNLLNYNLHTKTCIYFKPTLWRALTNVYTHVITTTITIKNISINPKSSPWPFSQSPQHNSWPHTATDLLSP